MINLKDSLLSKSVMADQQLSLQSERDSYTHTITLSSQPTRRKNKFPSQRVIQTVRDECYELEMRNFGVLRSIVKLYKRFPILNPQSTLILIWNIIHFIIIIFYLIEIGMLIGFGQPYWQDELNYFYQGNIVFIVLFLVDILISPLKAFYSNGILVISRVAIFKRYSRVYLWVDLIAFISVAAPYVSLSLNTNYFKLLFFLKLIAAYDLDKYLLMYVKNRFKTSHIYGLFRLVFFILLWSHWFAVGFFALDYWVYTTNYYGPNTPNYCWIYNSPLTFNISQAHWSLQYLYSLYFSIGNFTTIAYGDVVPRNPIEAIFGIISMTFAILIFTYFFKSMIQLIFESKDQQIENKQNFSVIQRFLKNNQVHKVLATKIRSYFETNWKWDQLRNKDIQEELINKLPKELRIQLNIAYYRDFIIQLGITHDLDLKLPSNQSPFICELSSAIQSERILARQLLYSQGEDFQQQQYVYFCDSGLGKLVVTLGIGQIDWPNAQLFLEEHNKEEDLFQLYGKSLVLANVGGIFGQESFFTQVSRSHWAIANKHMQILKLSRSKFDEILDQFGSKTEKQRVCIAKQNIVNRFCYICREKGHTFSKCSYVNYIPDQKTLLEQMKLQNSRINNSLITRNRQSWFKFTTKHNSWKLFNTMKYQHKQYLRKLEVNVVKDENVPEQEDLMGQHIFQELALLRTLVIQHAQKQHQTHDKYKQSLDVDQAHLFTFYTPAFNITEQVKRFNIYIKSMKKRSV